jgi:hypothetical protein
VRERESWRGGGRGGMGEEEKETTKKNVGVVFKNIFHTLNLTSSRKMSHNIYPLQQ